MTRITMPLAGGVAGIVAIALSGCSSQPLSPMAAAGSMRIEVEVYKGPLSQPVAVQMGELTGVLKEARIALGKYATSTRPECPAEEPMDCDREAAIDSAKQFAGLIGKLDDALAVEDLIVTNVFGSKDAQGGGQLIGHSSGSNEKTQIRRFAAEAAEIGAQLKARAFFAAYRELGDAPTDKVHRRDLTHFTTLAAEYGNQISARAAALLRQIDEGQSASEMALSDYLRDSAHTDFLRLYDWFDAAGRDGGGGDGLKLNAGDRVRLAQRLLADHNWSKVNEVQGNGQGEVRMAFIRGPDGNWDLKSFDNNPEELLNAYRSMTEAGIQLAIDVATKAASGGSAGALPTALDAAGQLIRGQVGGETLTTNTAQIGALRRRVVADLERIKVEAGQTETALQAAQGNLPIAQNKLTDAEQTHAKAQQDLAAKKAEIPAAIPSEIAALEQKERDSAAAVVAAQSDIDAANAAVKAQSAMMAKLVADARTALDTHRRVIEALQAQYVAADAG